jgi:O-antigen/teichoic acid export membrane protein
VVKAEIHSALSIYPIICYKLHHMSASLFRSLLANWLGLGISIGIGFTISPLVVNYLGTDLYGAWALIISITSQSIIFDLGARNAVVSFSARYRAIQDKAQLSTFLSNAFFFFLLGALAAFFTIILLLPFLAQLFDIAPQNLRIIQIAFTIAAVDAALDVLFGFYESVIAGVERFDTLNSLNIARLCLYALLIYIAIDQDLGLVGIAIAAFLAKLVQRILLLAFTKRYVGACFYSASNISGKEFRQLFNYGGWSALQQAAYRLIYRADSLIAGILLGTSAVAYYAVAVILIDQFRTFAESANNILIPRFSSLSAENNLAGLQKLILKWSRYSFALALTIGIPLILTGEDFLILWMGPAFGPSAAILQALTIPFFFVMPGLVFTCYLFAVGQHRISAQLLLLEMLGSLSLAFYLGKIYGFFGVAVGMTPFAILCRGILIPTLVCRQLKTRPSQYFIHSIALLLPLAALQTAAIIFAQQIISSSTWLGFIVTNLSGLATLAIVYSALYLDAEERSYLVRRVSSTFKK